jgi:hypothetical protein
MSTIALSETAMNENSYTLAGWLAIANAVLLPLTIVVDIVQGLLGAALFDYTGPMFGPADLLYIAYIGFTVYTLIKLRQLLNERFGFHEIDGLITLAVVWNILIPATLLLLVLILLVLGAASRELAVIAMLSHFAVSMLMAGVINILIGVKLMKLRDSMSEMLKVFTFLTLAAGIAMVSLILSPLALLITPIWCLLLGLIFLREREAVEFV